MTDTDATLREAREWRDAAQRSLITSTRECGKVIGHLLDRLATAERERARLHTAARDALDSLEYVESHHPGISGYGVRQHRIVALRAALQPEPTHDD
jgi:hypothetical protein